MNFDVIGDVHGQHDKLVGLLGHLGYQESGGAFRNAERIAIFVGDLIDRGPGQLATVDLVRRMMDAGSARCIMGNHEFNAIAWATPDPHHAGEFLRSHGRPGNLNQHRAFLDEVEGKPVHDEVIAWFKTLPLWLDLGGLRVVHACWQEASMAVLRPYLGRDDTLTEDLIVLGNQKGTAVFQAIEVVCKGPEVGLPAGIEFRDKEGKVRHEVRVRWWEKDLSTYRKAAIGPPGDIEMIPDLPMPAGWVREFRALSQEVATREAQDASRSHASDSPLPGEGTTPERPGQTENTSPVVFGHYWFTGRPAVISPKSACVDFSAAKDGPLVAYRWDGETELSSEKLEWVGKE